MSATPGNAPTRRAVLALGARAAFAASFGPPTAAAAVSNSKQHGSTFMPTMTTNDGVEIFFKDWGSKDAQPIVFHHGWPLSSDDWDAQMLFFVSNGYRVVAHDRRGHGRSAQVSDGHDMDHYARTQPRSPNILTCATRSMSATPPVAARRCAMWSATAQAEWSSWC
jgi:non-heme chloroperoxidase